MRDLVWAFWNDDKHVIVQLVEKLLRKSGDNTENPYILPLSFTGTAAVNIDGMTLHSAFNFPFSNEFLSLPDKLRDKQGRIHGRTVADGWAGAVM